MELTKEPLEYTNNSYLEQKYKSSRPEVLCKQVFLEIFQNSHENTCARVSFLIRLQAFSYRTPPVAASEK